MDETPARKTVPDSVEQFALFDVGATWKQHWWGMPAFYQGNAMASYRIVMNFLTFEDVTEFGKRLGLTLARRTDSAWFPKETIDAPSDWEYADEP